MKNTNVSIPIERYRKDPAQSAWELPPWGHPLSQGVMPLFISAAGRLIPVGTAFTTGSGVTFVISAEHNIREVFSHERRLGHLKTERTLPEAISLREVGLYVLYQRWHDESEAQIDYMLWPLENVDGAPPTDIVFGFPKFQTEWPTLNMRLGLELPQHGERVLSIGYTDFQVPAGGIDLDTVNSGEFNWRTDYAHKFVVVEGHVCNIFTQRFASSFVDGPCFSFDAEIFHGQSGGPIISAETGIVRGVNSAGATSYFHSPTSLGSLLYPLVMTNLNTGVQLGPIRLNSRQPVLNWIAMGKITTDGGENRLAITEAEGSVAVCASAPIASADFVYDDFAGFQEGRRATRPTGDVYRLRNVPH
jgi:hypothetical protein